MLAFGEKKKKEFRSFCCHDVYRKSFIEGAERKKMDDILRWLCNYLSVNHKIVGIFMSLLRFCTKESGDLLTFDLILAYFYEDFLLGAFRLCIKPVLLEI